MLLNVVKYINGNRFVMYLLIVNIIVYNLREEKLFLFVKIIIFLYLF